MYNKEFQALQQAINNELAKLNPGKEPSELYDPISYVLSQDGKRLRPLLVMLSYQMYKDDMQALKPALAVEIFHNFTLLHDDIMDQASLRRGEPTVHAKWNENTAILSGDVMFVKAYEQLLNVPPDLLRQVVRIFNAKAIEVCEGQQFDMNFETRMDVGIDEYLEMIRLKTAVLIGFSLKLGALLAKAPQKDQEILEEFGELIGVGFQLKDDLLDVYSNEKEFGKKKGGDIIANKKTYLMIHALAKANDRQREALKMWVQKKDFDPEEKVRNILSIYDEIGVATNANEMINTKFNKSFKLLEQLSVDKTKRSLLETYTRQLIDRNR